MAVQIDGSQGKVIATSGDYSGGVSIGGTLTYEDVTNIDAVGLITARNGIEIGARPGVGASISVDGNMIISGISTFGGTVTIPNWLVHDGDSNTKFGFEGPDTITAETGGSERLRINSSGQVVIGDSGSASPSGIVHLYQASNDPYIYIQRGSGDASNAIGGIIWKNNTNSLSQIVVNSDDINDGNMVFKTMNSGTLTETLRIASNGEVFIGDSTANTTTDRSTLLSISGAHQSPSAVWTQLGLYSNDSQAADKGGSIGFGGQDGSTTKQQFAAILGAKENGTSTNYAGYLSVYTRPAGAVSVERLRISSTGHMGLGVTPSAWPANGDSRGLQVGTGACLFGRGNGDEDRGGIGVNYYNDGSGNKYIGNGNASRIYMNDGNIDFEYGATNSSGADAALTLTTQMRITTQGYIRTPFMPVFHAQSSPTRDGSTGWIHSFGNLHSNVGTHFDNSTGKFVAPVNGYYFFGFTLWCNDSSVNDASGSLATVTIYNSSNTYQRDAAAFNVMPSQAASYSLSAAGSGVAYMAASDYAICKSQFSLRGSQPRNIFCGYLVHATT